MAPFTIKGAQIRRDDAGRCHIGDLHAAAGGKCAHNPELWKLRDPRYAGTVDAYARLGFDVKHGPISVSTDQGEYVDPGLVQAYAWYVGASFFAATVRALHCAWSADGEALRKAQMDAIVATALEQDRVGAPHSLWVH